MRLVGIRADASNRIGSGHLVRCLSLADELRSRGASVVLQGEIAAHLTESAIARGHRVVPSAGPIEDELADAAAAAQAFGGADWIVVDHYGLSVAWERRVRDLTGARVMAIDDLEREHACDVLLDQNFHAAPDERYADRLPATCTRLLGPRYALLRPEFTQARAGVQPRDGEVQRLLVFLGGADANNHTGTVLQAVAAVDRAGLSVDVVIGATHPAIEPVRSACASLADARCHVQTGDMAALLARADLAIGAGGVNTWERCMLGVPTLALCVADNQKDVLLQGSRAGFLYFAQDADLEAASLMVHLRALLDNPGLRYHLSRNALALVDGRGTQRVAGILAGCGIVMRKATHADGEVLHAWRNDPVVRGMSRSSAPIALQPHLQWLDAVLSSPTRHLLVGERGGEPVGVVRFDEAPDGSAEVSIYLVPRRMGRGDGFALLNAAQDWLRQAQPHIGVIHAEVNAGNEASHKLFERCGYVLQSSRYSRRMEP